MKIIVMAKEGDSTSIVYNKLAEEFGDVGIILEGRVSRKKLLAKRIRRLGLWKVMGQVGFLIFIKPFLKAEAKVRVKEIMEQYHLNLDRTYLDNESCYFVESVNSDECRRLLQTLEPDIVVVNGTRIIEGATIECIEAPMINMHAGITPKYRGVHGAYWALSQGDVENCGVTIHRIDTGIDTGEIIYQDCIPVTEADNFVTYPYLQTAVGIEMEVKAVRDYEAGRLGYIQNNLPSRLWTHPTWMEYLWFRRKGIK